MGAYHRVPFRRRKPNRPMRPNMAHPHLANCNAWWPFLGWGRGLTHDVISNIAATNTGGEWQENAAEFRGTGDRWQVAAADNPLRSALGFSEHTVFLDFYSLTTNALYRVVSNGLANDFEIAPNFSGGTVAGVATGRLGFYAQGSFGWTDVGPVTLGQRHRVLIRGSSSQGLEVFIDGTRTFDSATNWTNSVDGTLELSNLYNGTTDTDCNIFDFRFYTTWLDDAIVDDIFRNQWAPFERKIWVPVAAAAGITAEASPGTLTLTGQTADAVLVTAIDSQATAGVLTLTGVAADVEITVGTGIQAEGTPGTLTLTGQAADAVVTTNLDLEASAGAITLTGLAADFQTGVFVQADATPGAIALAGQAATVDITTALSLEATPGAIVLSGQQADVIGLVAPVIARPSAGGIKSRYRQRKTIIIDKKRYQVTSREEEAMLVARYIEELKAEQEALQDEPAEQKKVTRRLKLATTRLRKLDVDPTAHLRAIDDELLTMLGGVPWL